MQCSASCQFSNLGTKASSEVTSHYRTSVKNAGSILSMNLCFRNRLSAANGKQFCGQKDKSPTEAPTLIWKAFLQQWSLKFYFFYLQLCHISWLPLHRWLICGKLSVTPVPSLSIIYCTNNMEIVNTLWRIQMQFDKNLQIGAEHCIHAKSGISAENKCSTRTVPLFSPVGMSVVDLLTVNCHLSFNKSVCVLCSPWQV